MKGSWKRKEFLHSEPHTHTFFFLFFQLSQLFFLHCTALHISAAKHNLYCQDRCYKMKPNMAGIERVVCLQMITCHNMLLDFFFFPLNYHERHRVIKKIVILSLRNYNFNQEARRKVMNFVVQELNCNEIPNWMFKNHIIKDKAYIQISNPVELFSKNYVVP